MPCDSVDVDAPSPHQTSSPCPSELEYEEKKEYIKTARCSWCSELRTKYASDYTVTGRDLSSKKT